MVRVNSRQRIPLFLRARYLRYSGIPECGSVQSTTGVTKPRVSANQLVNVIRLASLKSRPYEVLLLRQTGFQSRQAFFKLSDLVTQVGDFILQDKAQLLTDLENFNG